MALRDGDIDLAMAAAEEGLEAARRSGIPIAIARCLTRLSDVAVAQHDGSTAAARAAEALAIARSAGAKTSIGMALIAGAQAAAASGDLPRSGALLVEAAAEFSQHGYMSPPVRIFAVTAARSIGLGEELSARLSIDRLDEVLSTGVPTDPGSSAALEALFAAASEHGRDDLVAPIAVRVAGIGAG
jgi:hypothetical protein